MIMIPHTKFISLAAISMLSLFFTYAIFNSAREEGSSSIETAKNQYAMLALLSKLTSGNPVAAPCKCSGQCDRVFGDVFKSLTSGYRRCLLEKIDKKDAVKAFRPAISLCLGDALWRLLEVRKFENRDDEKLAILPPANVPATGDFANCTEITLGIGGDIEAELALRRAQPHCKFHGADPIRESGKVFEELGAYYELGVDAQNGSVRANVNENGKYRFINVTAVSMVDFILNYVKVRSVDYMLMDNEGPEYRLFKQLISGGEVESNGISICQISAEMHYPFHTYNELINSILRNSSFLPIWQVENFHLRSFFINVDDGYCVGKYFRSKWCGDYQYYKAKGKTFQI